MGELNWDSPRPRGQGSPRETAGDTSSLPAIPGLAPAFSLLWLLHACQSVQVGP